MTTEECAESCPVIIGVGFCMESSADPTQCREASALMIAAIEDAARDAGDEGLCGMLETIAVQQGSWKYPNPGRLLADELGCRGATSVLSDLGVLQIKPFVDLCESIQRGEQSLGVVVGGESRFRDLRSLITGQPVENTGQSATVPPPDVYHAIPDPFATDLDDQRGLWAPGEFYAIADSAIRAARGESLAEHREAIGRLYSALSEIAARNPHAWRREQLSAAAISEATDNNPMVAFPFTKRMMAQWNVNQSVALIVCSVGRARQLGLDPSGWVYPLSAAQSRHVVPLAQKQNLHSYPGLRRAGEAAFAMIEAVPADLTRVDLYSCFPSALLAGAADLDIPSRLPLSITGSMAFAGGPFNHAALDSMARMVEMMRDDRGQNPATRGLGLVSNISGMFGKHGCVLFGDEPSSAFQHRDVTERVAAEDQPVPLDPNFVGEAMVAAYTVVYNKGAISHAIGYCDTPDGARAVIRSDDVEIARAMTTEEFVGRRVAVAADGSFKPG